MLVAPHARLLRSAECRDSLGGLTTLTTVSVHTPRLSSPLFMTDMLHSVYDVNDYFWSAVLGAMPMVGGLYILPTMWSTRVDDDSLVDH